MQKLTQLFATAFAHLERRSFRNRAILPLFWGTAFLGIASFDDRVCRQNGITSYVDRACQPKCACRQVWPIDNNEWPRQNTLQYLKKLLGKYVLSQSSDTALPTLRTTAKILLQSFTVHWSDALSSCSFDLKTLRMCISISCASSLWFIRHSVFLSSRINQENECLHLNLSFSITAVVSSPSLTEVKMQWLGCWQGLHGSVWVSIWM